MMTLLKNLGQPAFSLLDLLIDQPPWIRAAVFVGAFIVLLKLL